MKFYKVITLDGKRLLLPFNNNYYFRDFLLEKNISILSYKVIFKNYKISKKRLLDFTYNLLSLLETDMSIILSLDLILSQEDRIFSIILWNIKKDIINGFSIYESFKKYKEIFPSIYLNLICVGEKSNNLVKNLKKAYKNLKFQIKLSEKIKEAAFYPGIISIFLFGLLIFIFSYVLPNFQNFFQGSDIELPTITKVLLVISENIWKILSIIWIISVLIFLFFKLLPKELLEVLKCKIPILRFFIRNNIIINFSQNFSLMLDSKLDILDALLVLKRNSDYLFIEQKIEKIISNVRSGESIFNSFKEANIFSKEQLKIINIGEKTQNLSKAFEIITVSEEKKLEKQLFKLTSLIQPILLSVMGVIVAVILLAIYLPIFNISNNII